MNENINDLVDTVLRSPALRSFIQNSLNNNLNPHSSPIASSPIASSPIGSQNVTGSAIEEVRRLFPSIRSNSSSSPGSMQPQFVRGSHATKRKRGSTQQNKPYTKDIIILKSPLQTRTLTGKNKAEAYNDGFALSGVEFQKQWSPLEIKRKIEELFSEKLNGDFEFVVPIGGYLVRPKLYEHQINGQNLAKIFYNKVIYIRPLNEVENSNEAVIEELNQEEVPVVSTDCHTDEDAIWAVENVNAAERDMVNLFEPTSLKEILTELSKKIDEEAVTHFNIYREDIFNCCMRAMRRKSFAAHNRISVVFTDCEDNSEGAVDAGGPKREMFRLVFHYFNTSYLFGGPSNRKFIALNKEALEKNLYYEAGKIIAMAIVHCGFGPRFFSEAFYTLLVEGRTQIDIKLEDISETDIQAEIKQAMDAPDLDTLRNVIYEGTFIGLAGWDTLNDFGKKDVMINDVMKFYVVDRCLASLEQFKKGLETLEVYKYIKLYPEYFIELMCNTNEGILTLSKFNEIFTISYSEQGSNKRHVESRIVAFWQDYIIECDENTGDDDVCSLEELLTFATAVNVVPCSGFAIQPSIKFLHDSSIFPRGNTCGLELYLPTVHTVYDEFKSRMTYGIKNGMVFGTA